MNKQIERQRTRGKGHFVSFFRHFCYTKGHFCNVTGTFVTVQGTLVTLEGTLETLEGTFVTMEVYEYYLIPELLKPLKNLLKQPLQ